MTAGLARVEQGATGKGKLLLDGFLARQPTGRLVALSTEGLLRLFREVEECRNNLATARRRLRGQCGELREAACPGDLAGTLRRGARSARDRLGLRSGQSSSVNKPPGAFPADRPVGQGPATVIRGCHYRSKPPNDVVAHLERIRFRLQSRRVLGGLSTTVPKPPDFHRGLMSCGNPSHVPSGTKNQGNGLAI